MNSYERRKKLPKKKKVIFVVLVGVLVIAGCFGFYRYNELKEEKEKQALMDSLTMAFTEEIPFVEYGIEFDSQQFITRHTGELTYHEELDTTKVGYEQLQYTIALTDEKYGEFKKDFYYTALVKDTQYPEIKLNELKVTLKYGASFDPKSNVKEVTDPVDGNLEYTIEGTVDAKTVGDYKIVVKALDKNNNESRVEYTVSVQTKEEINNPSSGGGSGSNKPSKPSGGNGSNVGGSGSSGNDKPSKPDTKPEEKPKPPVDNNYYLDGEVWKGKVYANMNACTIAGQKKLDEHDGAGRFMCAPLLKNNMPSGKYGMLWWDR